MVVELVAGIAAGQWGMFTTAQAAAVGVSRLEVARLVEAGLVRRVRQGVHVMPGVPSGAAGRRIDQPSSCTHV